MGQGTELAQRPDRKIAGPHAAESAHEVQDVRMELVKVQELRHTGPAELEPSGQVGPSLNGSDVKEPLKLVCEG